MSDGYQYITGAEVLNRFTGIVTVPAYIVISEKTSGLLLPKKKKAVVAKTCDEIRTESLTVNIKAPESKAI